jgi:hypothetical protein
MGWYSKRLACSREELRHAEFIESQGGRVVYCYGTEPPSWVQAVLGREYFANLVALDVRSDEALGHAAKLSRADALITYGRGVTSAGMVQVESMQQLFQLDMVDAAISDSSFSHLAGLQQLNSLQLQWIERGAISDACFRYLRRLPHLTELIISEAKCTGVGIEVLAECRYLERLGLGHCPVSDRGVADISRLTTLRALDLSGTRITDAGLASLRRLTNLEKLSLQGAGITDAGLKCLADMHALTYLNVRCTRVTPQGIRNVKSALPNVDVDYGTTWDNSDKWSQWTFGRQQ